MFDKIREQIASLATTIQLGMDNRLKEVHTQMPGIIVDFNATKQTASVQPAIKRIFRTDDGESETLTPVDLPKLINVPVQFPRGGGYSMTFPVAPGDECLLEFCERSIDNWFARGGTQRPGAKRFHDLSDAVAKVGLSSQPKVIPNFNTSSAEFKKDDGSAVVTLSTGTVTITATTKIVLDAPVVENTTDVTVGNNINTTGVSTAADHNSGGISGKTHKHGGVQTGGGNTGVPQ